MSKKSKPTRASETALTDEELIEKYGSLTANFGLTMRRIVRTRKPRNTHAGRRNNPTKDEET